MRFASVRWQTILMGFLLFWVASVTARADTIRLKNGKVIQGQVIRFVGDEFVVVLPPTDSHREHESRMTISSHSVERIEFEGGSFSEPSGEPCGGRGVTLYSDGGFHGTSEVFYQSNPDLENSRVGNDRASSIRIPPGYVVTLYEHANYHGRSVVLRADERDLRHTPLGNDVASSIRVECIEGER